jgi:phenylalanyl-tRNA synthetase beta chain
MIVSFNWLKDYVAIDVPADELARRLMLAGLNHEETNAVGDDLAIDQVTATVRIAWDISVVARRLCFRASRCKARGKRAHRRQRASRTGLRHASPIAAPAIPAIHGPCGAWREDRRVRRLVERLATIASRRSTTPDITNYVWMEQASRARLRFGQARRVIIVRAAPP